MLTHHVTGELSLRLLRRQIAVPIQMCHDLRTMDQTPSIRKETVPYSKPLRPLHGLTLGEGQRAAVIPDRGSPEEQRSGRGVDPLPLLMET